MGAVKKITAKYRYSRVLIRFLTFFFIVFIFPFFILSFVIMSFHFSAEKNNQIRRIAREQEALASMLGNALREAERIAFSVAYNPSIIPNVIETSYMGNLECIYTINSHLAKNAIFNDIFIYFPNHSRNLIYTSTGTRQLDALRAYLPLEAVDLRTQLGQIKVPVLVPAYNNALGLVTDDLIYCYPVFQAGGDSWYMTVFFSVSGNYMQGYARSVTQNLGEITCVYNGTGRTLYTIVHADPLAGDDGLFAENLLAEGEDNPLLVSLAYEFSPDLVFKTFVPEHHIDRFVGDTQKPTRLVIWCVGFGGIILAVFFALRAYSPIYHLYRIFFNEPKIKGRNAPKNELDAMGAMLGNMLTENRRMSALLQDNTRSMQEQFLLLLLNGDAGSSVYENLGDVLSVLQLRLAGPVYTVFCVKLPDEIPARTKTEIIKRLYMSFSWLRVSVYPVTIASPVLVPLVVSIAVSGESQILTFEKVQKDLAAALHKFLSTHGLSGTVYGGAVYNELVDIDKAYTEALALVEHHGSRPKMTFLYSFDYVFGNQYGEEDPEKLFESLSRGILAADAESAKKDVRSFFLHLEKKPFKTAMRRFKTARLLSAVSAIFCQSGFWEPVVVDENMDVLVSCKNNAALTEKLDALIDAACVFFKSAQENRLPGSKMNELKEYLDVHFADPNLSLDQVAEIFDISPFHLSRNFKKFFNQNFVDYVSLLRIEKAKYLLAETDTKIKEIVEQVGYHDAANFIRKFRIIEGVTPGQYRTAKNADM